jgi:Glycosyltransferase family 87
MLSDETLRRVLPAGAVALLGDVIRAVIWGLVVVVWIAFLQVYARMFRLTLADPTHSDFTIFYYTARMIADGLPMYGESPARYGVTWAADHLGNLNPPHVQLLFLPLASLSYAPALAAFVAVSAVAFGLSIWLVVREIEIGWSWRLFWFGGALTISSAAFTTVAVTSELTFLLMVPFTLAWSAWRRERWTAAGAWLGVCASVKLFVFLFVPVLVWQRRWKALGACAAACAAVVLVGMSCFGAESYLQWTTTLGRVGWWWLPMNASWQGFVSRVWQGSASIEPVAHMEWLVKPLAMTGSTAIACAAVWLVRSRSLTLRERDRSMLLTFLGAILASPLGWVYYLPLAYGPLVGWLSAEHWGVLRNSSRRWLIILFVALACLYVPQEVAASIPDNALATVTIASAYFWGVLLLSLAATRPTTVPIHDPR